MNLDQQFLNNSLRSYIVIAAVFIVAFIVKRFISRFFASLIYTWIDKKKSFGIKKKPCTPFDYTYRTVFNLYGCCCSII
jgi:hypothetical protein